MRLTLKTSLIGMVLILLVFLVAQSWTAIHKIQAVNANTVEIATNWLPSVQQLGQIKYGVTRYRLFSFRSIVASDLEIRKDLQIKRENQTKANSIAFKSYEALISSPEEKQLWSRFIETWNLYLETEKDLEKRFISNNAMDISKLDEATAVPIFNKALEVLDEDSDLNDKSATAVTTEASANYNSAWYITATVSSAAVLVGIASIMFVFFRVTKGLTSLNAALGKMAGGELDIIIPGSDRGDEIGDMAKNVVSIRENAEKKARQEAEAKVKQDESFRSERKRDMMKLAYDFEIAVGEIVETISSASTELEASAATLTSTAERSQTLTIMVAAASEEASTNVQSVASATEELSSSVTEISRQVQDSATIAREAVGQAQQTNSRISELARAANRIGDVVELINTIAGQTNLLALNATIEAARAGEAGRGFAVVATEVKALAEQTAKATGEISQQVSGMQSATRDSVDAIKEIGETIAKMSEISSAIASAVEEQGAATQEIARNVQQAAQGTQQVSSNITDVQHGATETGSASSQVLSAAKSLSKDSSKLKQEVGKFLGTVRAA